MPHLGEGLVNPGPLLGGGAKLSLQLSPSTQADTPHQLSACLYLLLFYLVRRIPWDFLGLFAYICSCPCSF